MASTIDWLEIDWHKSFQLEPEQQSVHSTARWFVQQSEAKGTLASTKARSVVTYLLSFSRPKANDQEHNVKPELELRLAGATRTRVDEVVRKVSSITNAFQGRRPYGLFPSVGHAYSKVSSRDLADVCRAAIANDPDLAISSLLNRHNGRIFGLKLAGLSQLVHVLRPDLYPVLNGRTDFSEWQHAVSAESYFDFVNLSVALRDICNQLGFPGATRFKYLDRYLEATFLKRRSEASLGVPKGSLAELRRRLLKAGLKSSGAMNTAPLGVSMGVYVPTGVDDRESAFAAIKKRRGQPAFRKQLLVLHSRRCQISGATAEQVLEAAHIHAYRGDKDNHPANGLLLRADLHTLFDLGLVWIDAKSLQVQVAKEIQDAEYRRFHGKPLACSGFLPSLSAIRKHALEVAQQRE